MKKTSGKVVSLVLALALVVTSFSSTFAFASTKTLSGSVTTTDNDDIYLANGGDSREANLTSWLIQDDFKLETKDHHEASDPKITAISHVSGDKLVSLDLQDDDDTAYLKLKNTTADGTEVISVLFEGDYSDDDNDYTIKGKQTLTVHVYDEGAIVFGEIPDAGKSVDAGSAPDDVETFAQTANTTKTLGIFEVEPDNNTDSTKSTALATYKAPKLTTLDKGITTSDVYSLEITTGENDVHYNTDTSATGLADPDGEQFKDSGVPLIVGRGYAVVKKGTAPAPDVSAYTKDASTGNVTVTVKKVVDDGTTFKASSDSDDKYTLKTKIEKKVDIGTLMAYTADTTGVENAATVKSGTDLKIEKTNGKTVINDLKGIDGKAIVLTDADVVFPSDYTGKVTVDDDTKLGTISGSMGSLDIGDAHVDAVDIDEGSVSLGDGTVGDITTDGAHADVTIDSGKAGNIDTTDVDDGGDGDVTINGGTVGTINSDNTIKITANNDDEPIVTGVVTGKDITAYSDEATIKMAGVKASDDNAAITLEGSSTTVDSVDLDYREDATLNLGSSDDNEFVGTVAAPVNAVNGKLNVENEDTVATIDGAIDVDTISLDSDTNTTFTGNITVDTLDGDGTLNIKAGGLYVTGSASGVTLKLTDATLSNGMTVFKAASDAVDEEDMNLYGFTVAKTEGSVDTFKIASLSLAGLQIDKTTAKVAKGYSETFTASAYPGGTSLPADTQIAWDFDGNSDVFDVTYSGNTATVTVKSIDDTFTSENVGTLTATLQDEDGYDLDDYAAGTSTITAIAVPEAKSDTTTDFSVAKGSSYTMKVTSVTAPVVTLGTGNVFAVTTTKNGNDYFYKFTATGNVGAATGVYLNGTKLLVASVKAAGAAFTSDTTKDVKVTKGNSYTYKITSTTTPSFGFGSNGVFTVSGITKSGNNYFFKITATGNAGKATGVFVNGVKVNVATVG